MQALSGFFFKAPLGAHIFLADGSRIYESSTLRRRERSTQLVPTLPIWPSWAQPWDYDGLARFIDDRPPPLPALHALSLTVAQAWNMGLRLIATPMRAGLAARRG